MIARRRALGLSTSGLALVLGTCRLVKSYAPFRYRITIEVGTTLGRVGAQVRNKAAAVDIPGRQTLFALLQGGLDINSFEERSMFEVSPGPQYQASDDSKGWPQALEAVRANLKVNLVPKIPRGYFHVDPSFSAYPMEMQRRDITGLKSIEIIDPDSLTASFGPGVKPRHITVRVTEGPVTVCLGNSIAYFNVDGDLFTGHNGWLKGGDEFVMHDINEVGRVDGNGVMFGSREGDGSAEPTANDNFEDARDALGVA